MNPTNVSNTAPFSEETILPFRIQIPESDLLDLKERLTRTRWPDDLEDNHWEYGTPLSYLKSYQPIGRMFTIGVNMKPC